MQINGPNRAQNRIRDKKHLFFLIESQNAFDKIQHSFITKVLKKLGIEGICLNIIKAINDKSITNIILNGEKLFLLLCNIVL
jgi:hypothetical protein